MRIRKLPIERGLRGDECWTGPTRCDGGHAVAYTRADAKKPVSVNCGEIITVDTKLANDLIDCPGNGIIIGAHNITLDLNGHTIDGDDEPVEFCPAEVPCDIGVVNTEIRAGKPVLGPGYDGVTITNGAVREFVEGGVHAVQVSDNHVRRLVVSKNGNDAIGITRSEHSTIERNSINNNQLLGIAVGLSHDITIEGNAVSNNGGDIFSGGIFVFDSSQVRIVKNSVSGTLDGDGIGLVFGANDNVVSENSIFGNGGGLAINDSDRNLIRKNRITDNQFIGAYTNGGDENHFDQNYIARNSDGSAAGIELDTSTDFGGTADRNIVTRNTLVDNVGDGIRVDPGGTGNLIERNVATGNTDDGIDLDSAPTTVTRNTANRNGDLGIEAVPGVIDGGRNKASGNGNPLQCTNVFCR